MNNRKYLVFSMIIEILKQTTLKRIQMKSFFGYKHPQLQSNPNFVSTEKKTLYFNKKINKKPKLILRDIHTEINIPYVFGF